MKQRSREGVARKRPYRMRARAEAAERTAQSVLRAVVELWKDRPLDEITLQEVADRAGVTVQTVIRRFGSKDGLIDAALRTDPGEIIAQRATAPAGDVPKALGVLLDHYEEWGDAALRTLALEERYPAARRVAEGGRAEHRKWCRRFLASEDTTERSLDALVAATDLYVWKLLRRDLGRSRAEARAVMETLVSGVLEQAGGSPAGSIPARRR